MSYRTLLVPLDGSAFSESALPFALDLSRRTEAGLRLLVVQEPLPGLAEYDWADSAHRWMEEYVREVAARVKPDAGGSVEPVVRAGLAPEEIHREAEEASVDLVVMATHGRGVLNRAWLGSVADTFVRHTTCPVLLVRPEQEVGEGGAVPRPVRRVLVPLDGTDVSEAILDVATGFAELVEAEMILLRVIPLPMDQTSPYLPYAVPVSDAMIETGRAEADGYLEARAARLRERGLTVRTEVEIDAQPAHAILTVARREGADLITMATHGRSGISRAILGSVTDKVVRGGAAPVLLVRPSTA